MSGFGSYLSKLSEVKQHEGIFEIRGTVEITPDFKVGERMELVGVGNNATLIFHKLRIEHCENFTFRNLHIVGSIFVDLCRELTLDKCTFCGAEEACVQVEHSTGKVTNCDFTGSLFLSQQSRFHVSKLKLHDSNETLLVVRSGSTVEVEGCHFADSKANGIFCIGHSNLKVVRCKFERIEYASVYGQHSVVHAQYLDFKSVYGGFSMSDVRDFYVDHCKIEESRMSGIILHDSKAIISNFNCKAIDGNGIYCTSSSEAVVNNCVFDNCNYPGIAAIMHSVIKVAHSQILHCRYSAFSSRAADLVEITDCEIDTAGDCCLSVSDTLCCQVKKCRFKNAVFMGVESYNQAHVQIEDSELESLGQSVFCTFTGGTLVARNCVVKNAPCLASAYAGGNLDIRGITITNVNTRLDFRTTGSVVMSDLGQFSSVTNDRSKLGPNMRLLKKFTEDSKICWVCKAKPRTQFLKDCGHCVLCEDCAKELLKEKEPKCPWCRFPVVGSSCGYDMGQTICSICLDKPIEFIVLPCGHMSLCKECTLEWFKDSKNCPICGTEQVIYRKISYY